MPDRTDPFVSVVVPSRNRGHVLMECLESLARQDYPAESYEVIVVDDGSREPVELGSRTEIGPAMRCIRQRPSGLNAARNRGISESRAGLIAFVDDDIIAPEDWLSELVAAWCRRPDSGCIGGPIRLRLEGNPPRLCKKHALGETELDLGSDEREVDRAYGANFAVTRRGLELAGAFDESLPLYGEEQEWQHRLFAAGGIVLYAPRAWLWHRRLPGDLKVGRLVKGRFRRGRSNLAVSSLLSKPAVGLRRSLRNTLLGIRHAAVRRCTGGILDAAFWSGYAFERLRSNHR